MIEKGAKIEPTLHESDNSLQLTTVVITKILTKNIGLEFVGTKFKMLYKTHSFAAPISQPRISRAVQPVSCKTYK